MSSAPIYSFPEFKEPEKSSSWKADVAERDAVLAQVDPEYAAAQRRTALIKEHMSPPGALDLPPLLEAQRLKYGITDAFFKVQASFDRIFVFPIDAEDGEKAEKTTGGIYKPQVTRLRDLQEGNRGVLISAGLSALDRLLSHGYEIGHVVITNKNVPFARRCEEISGRPLHYLVMRDGDLAGSETLMEELRAGKKRIIEVPTERGMQHQIEVVGERPLKKQDVYVADTW
jgi:hypothetical protein